MTIKIKTPALIARFIFRQKREENSKGPFVVGLLTGLMPCGPLQAMQLYALTTGDFFRGAVSMGIFSLGTIPMMFGFGAFISTIGRKHAAKMMKFSGVLIIVLGFLMFNRGLVNFGYGFNFMADQGQPQKKNILDTTKNDFQEVRMDLAYYGYQPNVLYIKGGAPVRWIINVKQMSGCTNAIMIESLGIKKNLEYGENIIEFTPPAGVKEIKFSCWMRMVWGKFIVADGGESMLDVKTVNASEEADKVVQSAGGCVLGSDSCGCGCGGNKIKNNQNQGAGLVSDSCH